MNEQQIQKYSFVGYIMRPNKNDAKIKVCERHEGQLKADLTLDVPKVHQFKMDGKKRKVLDFEASSSTLSFTSNIGDLLFHFSIDRHDTQLTKLYASLTDPNYSYNQWFSGSFTDFPHLIP